MGKALDKTTKRLIVKHFKKGITVKKLYKDIFLRDKSIVSSSYLNYLFTKFRAFEDDSQFDEYINKNASKTTESSMFQTFKDETKKHFNENNKESLWNLFVEGWFEKTKSIKNYYLMVIIREKETLDCSLCCFKVNDILLKYSQDLCNLDGKTMKIDGIVNQDYADD